MCHIAFSHKSSRNRCKIDLLSIAKPSSYQTDGLDYCISKESADHHLCIRRIKENLKFTICSLSLIGNTHWSVKIFISRPLIGQFCHVTRLGEANGSIWQNSHFNKKHGVSLTGKFVAPTNWSILRSFITRSLIKMWWRQLWIIRVSFDQASIRQLAGCPLTISMVLRYFSVSWKKLSNTIFDRKFEKTLKIKIEDEIVHLWKLVRCMYI